MLNKRKAKNYGYQRKKPNFNKEALKNMRHQFIYDKEQMKMVAEVVFKFFLPNFLITYLLALVIGGETISKISAALAGIIWFVSYVVLIWFLEEKEEAKKKWERANMGNDDGQGEQSGKDGKQL